MKQGNSESDQPPDFVCFRKVVYLQGRNPEFRMSSKKKKNREKKIGFSGTKFGFPREKIGFSRKKSDFREKNSGFRFPRNVS